MNGLALSEKSLPRSSSSQVRIRTIPLLSVVYFSREPSQKKKRVRRALGDLVWVLLWSSCGIRTQLALGLDVRKAQELQLQTWNLRKPVEKTWLLQRPPCKKFNFLGVYCKTPVFPKKLKSKDPTQ